MNKKQWIIAGIIFVALPVIGIVALLNRPSDDTVRTVRDVPVLKLVYCSEESAKPCIVSFSTDANDNMLVNILLPDMAFPIFYLKIDHSEGESMYNCQRVRQANSTAYCAGKKLHPGEVLHLSLVSIRDSIVLAEGDLSIIGLAYPTLGIVIPTSEVAAAELSAIPAPTETPNFIIPLPTQTQRPTPTVPSYPPPYPNPTSYP